jgi:hypothetical protein
MSMIEGVLWSPAVGESNPHWSACRGSAKLQMRGPLLRTERVTRGLAALSITD